VRYYPSGLAPPGSACRAAAPVPCQQCAKLFEKQEQQYACPLCKLGSYCGQDCVRAAWKRHRKVCRGCRVGDTVMLHGLAKKEYNGLRGTVMGSLNAEGRYPVAIVAPPLGEKRTVKLKPENVASMVPPGGNLAAWHLRSAFAGGGGGGGGLADGLQGLTEMASTMLDGLGATLSGVEVAAGPAALGPALGGLLPGGAVGLQEGLVGLAGLGPAGNVDSETITTANGSNTHVSTHVLTFGGGGSN